MRTVIVLAALFTSSAASAEIRLINATGQPLTVDVLHAKGQVRDLALPATQAISSPQGPDIGGDDNHMVVVRNAAGEEIVREKMRGDRIHVIKFWGSSTTLAVGEVGMYRGTEFDMKKIGLINATGEELNYRTELPDFSITEEDSDPNGANDVHYTKLQNVSEKIGVTMQVEVKGEKLPKSTHAMLTGGLYYVTKSDGAIVVEAVGRGTAASAAPKAD